MEKSVKITLIIAIAVVVLGIIVSNSLPANGKNTISVNGQSQIEVIPDVIVVYFGVETEGATSKEAENKNSEISDALKTNLVLNGFAEKELQTVSYNIYPNYNWKEGGREIIGYRASHTMKVELTIDESDDLGKIVNSATEANALISSINFELTQEKQNEYKAEALKLAAQDAKIKAEAIAQGFGKRLGRLISTSDSNFYYYPSVAYDGASMSKDIEEATVDIQPSEQAITARVTATYKIY